MIVRLAFAHKLAALAGAGLLGTATAAAAAGADLPLLDLEPEVVEVVEADVEAEEDIAQLDDPGTDIVDVEPEVVDDPVEEPVEPPADEDGTPYGDDCDAARNHGAYVSSVARDERLAGTKKGAIVSQAARTSCGKPDEESSDHDELDDDEADDDELELEDDEADDDELESDGDGKKKGRGKGDKGRAKADRGH